MSVLVLGLNHGAAPVDWALHAHQSGSVNWYDSFT